MESFETEDIEKINRNIEVRLKRIEGQLKGITKMIENCNECNKVLIQISAVRAALNKVGAIILKNYALHCFKKDLQEKNEEKIKEFIKTVGVVCYNNESFNCKTDNLKEEVLTLLNYIQQDILDIRRGACCNICSENVLLKLSEARDYLNIIGIKILQNYTSDFLLKDSLDDIDDNLEDLVSMMCMFMK